MCRLEGPFVDLGGRFDEIEGPFVDLGGRLDEIEGRFVEVDGCATGSRASWPPSLSRPSLGKTAKSDFGGGLSSGVMHFFHAALLSMCTPLLPGELEGSGCAPLEHDPSRRRPTQRLPEGQSTTAS